MLTETEQTVVLKIAQAHFPQIDTLATRNSDALDFHEIAVWQLKAALEDAFAAGRASAAP